MAQTVPMPAQKFTPDGILDAAADEVVLRGSAITIGDVSRRLEAPSGSIYHRFGSRQELLVRLWLRSIRRFHRAYLAAGDRDDPDQALMAMAVCVAEFSADHPTDASCMTLYRQTRLVDSAPDSCRDEVRDINADVQRRLAELTAARYPDASDRHRTLVRVAAIDSPYGLVRPYIETGVPGWLPEIVRASSAAILALGDR